MELSPELRDYLRYCGVSERKLARYDGATRMYHDMGLYGDVAEAYMEALAERYNIDMSGFEFKRYFPPEFVGKNTFSRTLLWLMPFAGAVARQRREYEPLTLEMIERVLRAKRWHSLP